MSSATSHGLLRPWVILLLAMWAVMADSWGRASISIIPIRPELGLKIAQIGYVFGAQALAFAAGSLVMAVLIALAGVRWVYGAAILGDALAMVLLGGTQRLSWLVAASACRGFFGGAILAGGIQVVAEWFPPRLRTVTTGLFLGAIQVTTLTAPLLTGWLYERLARNSLFLLAGVGFLAFPFWVWLCQPRRSEGSASLSISRSLDKVFRAPQTLGLMLGVLLASPAGHFDFLGFMRGWYNRDPASLGRLLIIPVALSAAGAPLGGLSSDLLVWMGWPSSKSRRLVAQTFALSILLLPAVFVPYPALALIFAGVSQLGYQGFIAVLYAEVADSVPIRGLPFAVLLANAAPANWVNLASENVAPQWGFWPVFIGLLVMCAAAATAAAGHFLRLAGRPADEYVPLRLVGQPGGLWRRLTALVLDFAGVRFPFISQSSF
jgi:MFS family permease